MKLKKFFFDSLQAELPKRPVITLFLRAFNKKNREKSKSRRLVEFFYKIKPIENKGRTYLIFTIPRRIQAKETVPGIPKEKRPSEKERKG